MLPLAARLPHCVSPSVPPLEGSMKNTSLFACLGAFFCSNMHLYSCTNVLLLFCCLKEITKASNLLFSNTLIHLSGLTLLSAPQQQVCVGFLQLCEVPERFPQTQSKPVHHRSAPPSRSAEGPRGDPTVSQLSLLWVPPPVGGAVTLDPEQPPEELLDWRKAGEGFSCFSSCVCLHLASLTCGPRG